jgi:nucleoside-diphosphate kinase
MTLNSFFTEVVLQRTLVIVKPDGVQRGLVGKILARFEERGMKIVALKMEQVSRQLAEEHYAVHKGKFFYEDLVSYIGSSPVVVMVLEGHEAIGAVRAMVGATRPWEATAGTIRGDYALMGLRNLVHASDAPETAEKEIALWFKPEELMAYSREVDRWVNE